MNLSERLKSARTVNKGLERQLNLLLGKGVPESHLQGLIGGIRHHEGVIKAIEKELKRK